MSYRDWLEQKYRGQEVAAMDAALDTALYWLRREDGTAVSMDDAPASLEVHDRRYHKQGWKEGDVCEYREELAKGDSVDNLLAAEVREGRRVSGGQPMGFLSRKKQEEYRRLMAKKHPDMDADKVLGELAKIEDGKVRGDAFQWLMKGAIRLPEDLYKVEQARELAGKAKRNPTEWDTPQACINELTGEGHKLSEKPITVEELKKNALMSDYRDEGYGVETFQVEDSWQGQALMRRVIDTHWGKGANPWCLLARTEDNEGEEDEEDYYLENAPSHNKADSSLRNAWNYWQHYNALPKRVAFKDGKLLAFMATEGMDEEQAFDDAAYGDASVLSRRLPGLYAEYRQWERSDEGQEEGANFYEWLDHEYPDELRDFLANPPEEWWDRKDKSHAGIPLGNMAVPGDEHGRWADFEIRDGKLERVGGYAKKDSQGNEVVSWNDHGDKNVNEGDFLGYFPAGTKSAHIDYTYHNGPFDRRMYIKFKDGKVAEKGLSPGTYEWPPDVDEVVAKAERLFKKHSPSG